MRTLTKFLEEKMKIIWNEIMNDSVIKQIEKYNIRIEDIEIFLMIYVMI